MPEKARVVGEGASCGGCNDVFFAILFLVNTGAIVVLALKGVADVDLHAPSVDEQAGEPAELAEKIHELPLPVVATMQNRSLTSLSQLQEKRASAPRGQQDEQVSQVLDPNHHFVPLI